MTAADVGATITSLLGPAIESARAAGQSVSNETDLRSAGLIDSLRFVQLIGELEARLGITIDLSGMDPARLTVLGDLARHIASHG